MKKNFIYYLTSLQEEDQLIYSIFTIAGNTAVEQCARFVEIISWLSSHEFVMFITPSHIEITFRMKKPEKIIPVRYNLPEPAHKIIRDHRSNMETLSREEVTLENALIDLLLNKVKVDKLVVQVAEQ